jgi:hypothetical protein
VGKERNVFSWVIFLAEHKDDFAYIFFKAKMEENQP